MLRKILKYNLRAIYRQLVFFYLIAFTCAIIGRCFSNYGDNLLLKIIHEFFAGAAVGLCFGIVINNATRIWEHTKRDFYGDQSYLTHTLPVSSPTLYLAKFCTIIITVFTSLLTIALVLFINYASTETFEFIKQLINNTGSVSEFIKFVTLIVGVLSLEIVFITQVGITGIIIGHRANSHKAAFSFACGFALFLCANIITVALGYLWGIFDPEVSRMLTESYSTNSVMAKLLTGGIVIYMIHIAANYFIGEHLFSHGVDVE